MTVNHQLAELALQRAGGFDFEAFCQPFFASLTGANFIPVGGYHDGGADGFDADRVFEAATAGQFWQFSIEQNHRSKIRRTVKALTEGGRTPKLLTYGTTAVVQKIDQEEDLLSEELGIRVRIRDLKYIVAHINNSPATIEAFNSYLLPLLSFLKEIGGVSFFSHSPNLPDRTLCVFLGQEVERRRGNTELLESVTDSLILWSLGGTDPDKGILMDRAQILAKILEALPAASKFIQSKFDQRIEALTKKDHTSGRELRWYKKTDQFCLPHTTRLLVEKENSEDEILRNNVSDIFRKRAGLRLQDENEAILIPQVVSLCHRVLEILFEKQGLELTYFLNDSEAETGWQQSIADLVDQAMNELNVGPEDTHVLKEVVLAILREAFYNSEPTEREYLQKLSRTYTLLFILKNEPRIVEYFRQMSADFILYLGADLIIRALSEALLPEQDRMTWNMLKVLRKSGSTLVLTESTVDEVVLHLRAQDLEYNNHYRDIEAYLTPEIARHSDRIIIRAYLYGRLDPVKAKRPRSWGSFIGRFCTYEDLFNPDGAESLMRYLCEEFGLEYEDRSQTEKGVDPDELEELKLKLMAIRSQSRVRPREDVLSYSDALQVLRVFQRRKEVHEINRSNPFGHRVWWLTQETSVWRATKDLSRRRTRYMMRPEFVLNFIALAPSVDDVRKSFATIFPSVLGVRLSNRLRPQTFERVLEQIKEASELGEARAKTLAAELSDKLKGDQYKTYEVTLNGARDNS
ncbi:hypothetical protein [Bradyrhizobium sp. LB13.1]